MGGTTEQSPKHGYRLVVIRRFEPWLSFKNRPGTLVSIPPALQDISKLPYIDLKLSFPIDIHNQLPQLNKMSTFV